MCTTSKDNIQCQDVEHLSQEWYANRYVQEEGMLESLDPACLKDIVTKMEFLCPFKMEYLADIAYWLIDHNYTIVRHEGNAYHRSWAEIKVYNKMETKLGETYINNRNGEEVIIMSKAACGVYVRNITTGNCRWIPTQGFNNNFNKK